MVMQAIKMLTAMLIGLMVIFAWKYGGTQECHSHGNAHSHASCCGHVNT
jgi:hypothetical protein